MVAKVITPGPNVVNLRSYQQQRNSPTATLRARCCRHCGAQLDDDEAEDDCSSAVFTREQPVRLRRPR